MSLDFAGNNMLVGFGIYLSHNVRAGNLQVPVTISYVVCGADVLQAVALLNEI